MTRLSCDGPTLIRSVAAAVANLERHVAEVDALNVFPVPDGDTGSNMLATLRAALAEAERLPDGERQLGPVAEALGRGALRGARGNSGVILAEIIRGMTTGVDGRRRALGPDLAAGLRRGTETAYDSVLDPVEGTMLTVIRDAAAAAETEAARHRHVERVLSAAVAGAARSVDRTPALLPLLADAGVVDSGGQGLLRILEGTLLLGLGGAAAGVGTAATVREPVDPHPHLPAPGRSDTGYGYETVYLVESELGAIDIDALRREIHALGDSVVVAGDARTARVHVHGPRPDLAISVGLRLGRLSDVSVTDLDADAAEVRGHQVEAESLVAVAPAVQLALVAIAEAEGAELLLERMGVDRVVRPGAEGRPAADELAQAIASLGARHVLVLGRANDEVAVDESARLAPGVAVTAVDVGDIAGVVAAVLAFDASGSPEANAARMGDEARRLRRVVVRDVEGPDEVVERIREVEGPGVEVVTLYSGDGVAPGVEDAVRAAIVAAWPDAAIDVVFAARPGRDLLVVLD